MNERMYDLLNRQVKEEFYSGYLYLSMSTYFISIGLPGFGNWMRAQAQEELTHGMMLLDFIHERGEQTTLLPVEAPPTSWESPMAAVEEVLSHEKTVTGLINDLVDLAIELKDHATNNYLQWFVAEQVEEEASAGELVDKMKLVGTKGTALYMLDKELATRVYTPPEEFAG